MSTWQPPDGQSVNNAQLGALLDSDDSLHSSHSDLLGNFTIYPAQNYVESQFLNFRNITLAFHWEIIEPAQENNPHKQKRDEI